MRAGSLGTHKNFARAYCARRAVGDFGGATPSTPRPSKKPRFELLAVGAIVDPFAGSSDPLASRNCCGMADDGHDVTMTARLGAQNAKAILCVVVGNALNEARQHFLVW